MKSGKTMPWPDDGPDMREISASFSSWTAIVFFEEEGWMEAVYDEDEGWMAESLGWSFDSITAPTHYVILETPEQQILPDTDEREVPF